MDCLKSRKVRHETEAAARSHRHRLALYSPEGSEREVYRCGWCDGWHVGRRRLKRAPFPRRARR